MIENFIVSESIKDKISLEQFDDNLEVLRVNKLICKSDLIYLTFIYDDNFKIKKNYNIKSIYIEEVNYNFKEKLSFNFYSFECSDENKLITFCIEKDLFWRVFGIILR